MRVVNDLLGYKDKKIVQDTDYFSFSLDSVLLPNFVNISKDCSKILDIGTGNAPIPLILSTKTDAEINGIEIQKEIYDLACETLEINNLSCRIHLINDDVNNLEKYFFYETFDLIVSNPPYFKINEGSKKNDILTKAVARHEIKLNLDQLLKIAFKFLKNDGVFAMVHRTERMSEILNLMHLNRIEPKRILLVFPKKYKSSNLFLVEGVKNAKSGLKSVDKIIIHNDNGDYTDEVLKYFE